MIAGPTAAGLHRVTTSPYRSPGQMLSPAALAARRLGPAEHRISSPVASRLGVPQILGATPAYELGYRPRSASMGDLARVQPPRDRAYAAADPRNIDGTQAIAGSATVHHSPRENAVSVHIHLSPPQYDNGATGISQTLLGHPASAPLPAISSPSAASVTYETRRVLRDPLLFGSASPAVGVEHGPPVPEQQLQPTGSAGTSAEPISLDNSPVDRTAPAPLLHPDPLMAGLKVPRSPSPSQFLPVRAGEGIATTIRYWDSDHLRYVDWQPFRRWLWKIPESVNQVVDWHNRAIRVDSKVTCVATFSALDEALVAATVAEVIPTSQAPPMLFHVKPGDRLQVLQIFNIRSTAWLACMPIVTSASSPGRASSSSGTATVPMGRRSPAASPPAASGSWPPLASTPERAALSPGFIPLKAVVEMGGELLPTAIAPSTRFMVPLHSSARSFDAQLKFTSTAGLMVDRAIVGVVYLTCISYAWLEADVPVATFRTWHRVSWFSIENLRPSRHTGAN